MTNPFDDLHDVNLSPDHIDFTKLTIDELIDGVQQFIRNSAITGSKYDSINKLIATLHMESVFNSAYDMPPMPPMPPTEQVTLSIRQGESAAVAPAFMYSHHDITPDIVLSQPPDYHGVIRLLCDSGTYVLHVVGASRAELEQFHVTILQWWDSRLISYHEHNIHVILDLSKYDGYRYDIHNEDENGVGRIMGKLAAENDEL